MAKLTTIERNKKLRAHYSSLRKIKSKGGKEKYSRLYCIELTANKFFLSEDRVSVIVYSND